MMPSEPEQTSEPQSQIVPDVVPSQSPSDSELMAKMAAYESQGEPDASQSPEPEPTPEPEAKTEEAAPAEAVAEAHEPPEGYAEGLAALKRWNTPSKVIESLSEQEIAAWGSDARQWQSQVDAMGRRFDQIARDKTDDDREPSRAPEADLSDILAPLKELDEDTAKAVQLALKNVESRMAERVADIENRMFRANLDGVRDRYVSEYPALKNRAVFDRVVDRMLSLSSSGDAGKRYGSDLSKLMSDAATLELGSPLKPKDAQEFAKTKNDRLSSQSQPPPRNSQSAPPKMSRDDILFRAFVAAEQEGLEAGRRLKSELEREHGNR